MMIKPTLCYESFTFEFHSITPFFIDHFDHSTNSFDVNLTEPQFFVSGYGVVFIAIMCVVLQVQNPPWCQQCALVVLKHLRSSTPV